MIKNKILRKIFSFFFSIFLASLIIFFCIEILHGDVAQFILGVQATPAALQNLRVELGLDLPYYQRYFFWIADLLRGDLGQSYVLEEQNVFLLRERLTVSLPLILGSLFFSFCLSHLIGLFSFFIQNLWFHRLLVGFLQIGIALPSFWLATLLIIFFGVQNQWLPVGDFPGWDFHSLESLANSLWYLVLPVLSLSIPQTAIFTRVVKNSLKDTESEYFIKTAVSKGLSKYRILFFHILPYSLIPIITIVVLQIPFLFTGAVLIENIFYLPGVGRLLLQAIYQRDIILVKNTILLLFVFVIFIQFLARIIISFCNPETIPKQKFSGLNFF